MRFVLKCSNFIICVIPFLFLPYQCITHKYISNPVFSTIAYGLTAFYLIFLSSLQINRRLRSSIAPQINTKLQASLNRVYQDVEKLKRRFYRPSPRSCIQISFFYISKNSLRWYFVCRSRTETRWNPPAAPFRQHRGIGLYFMLPPALETCHDTVWSHLLLDVPGPLSGLFFGLPFMRHISGWRKRELLPNKF